MGSDQAAGGEWFATRSPELAHAPTAAARKSGVDRLRASGSPLASEFDAAKERAEALGKMVRASKHYPMLGGGDINLYSLFVERAMGLVKPDGIVGLLTPSGIYADMTAAKFFRVGFYQRTLGRTVRLREPASRHRPPTLLSRCGLPVQVLRPDIRR